MEKLFAAGAIGASITDLKPCPFCGSGAIHLFAFDSFDGHQGDGSRWTAKCTSCGASVCEQSKSEVVEVWNGECW
jgi:Lar family restriction alleviation protein